MAGNWNYMIFNGFSIPNHSIIQWLSICMANGGVFCQWGSSVSPGVSLWATCSPGFSSCPPGSNSSQDWWQTWPQGGPGMSPSLVTPGPTDGDRKTWEVERRKNCFPGCKAETCRNEVTWQRPLGTKAWCMFFQLQSCEFIETHPSCSLRLALAVPWGASATLGGAARLSPGETCLERLAAPLSAPWSSSWVFPKHTENQECCSVCSLHKACLQNLQAVQGLHLL